MKYLVLLFSVFIMFLSDINGQTNSDAIEGTVTFITTQNIYVKFKSTSPISVGDTLYRMKDSQKIPILKVNYLSSISCVCSAIDSVKLVVNDKTYAFPKTAVKETKVPPVSNPNVAIISPKVDLLPINNKLNSERKQEISGRVAVSSYSNISSQSSNSFRMRYTLSLNAQNIGNSKLSSETYISFSHKMKEWSDIQNNIFNGLKIYNLSVNYAFNNNNNLWLGRKINYRISNVGAIDGVQYENKIKMFSVGFFAGSRPDYLDYSYNASLLQFGGYIGHDYSTQNGMMQSSLAFVEQMNNGNTDRRFAYLQHSNSLVKNLYFFGSVEFDLYNKVLNTQNSTYSQDNTPKLSNLFVSIRYRVMKQLSLSLAYSNRENVVYYETYKNIIDQLLDNSKMQGYMFQINYAPINNLAIGASTGYRFSKKDPLPTKNLYSYITYNNVPWIEASTTLSVTLLKTSYLIGKIYSLGLSRDLVPGKVYGGLSYRYVDYQFVNNETPLAQNMAEMNITWRILKKLSCSLNCEGTFEKGANFQSIYLNITQRF